MSYGKKENDNPGKPKHITLKEAREKAASYCAYRERTQQEVRNKLYTLGVHGDYAEQIISWLITENFINEERYAKSYASGKFRIKKWGRLKIEQGLKQAGLSDYCIRQGLAEIKEEEYSQMAKELIGKKKQLENEKDPFKKKHKIARYMIGKGFEPELVWEILKGGD